MKKYKDYAYSVSSVLLIIMVSLIITTIVLTVVYSGLLIMSYRFELGTHEYQRINMLMQEVRPCQISSLISQIIATVFYVWFNVKSETYNRKKNVKNGGLTKETIKCKALIEEKQLACHKKEASFIIKLNVFPSNDQEEMYSKIIEDERLYDLVKEGDECTAFCEIYRFRDGKIEYLKLLRLNEWG